MLAGKLAFVTGAGSGIGRAGSQALAREGAKVIVADQNIKSAEETVSLLDGVDHLAVEVDISQAEAVRGAFERIASHYGKVPTILVNSAGIVTSNFLLKLSEAEFDRVVEVNLKGTFLVMQTGVNKMIEYGCNEGGSIVNIGSLIGKTGGIRECHYAASKAGVEALTKSASMELGKIGVRVNVVLPGAIETPIVKTFPKEEIQMFIGKVPLGRIGRPEEAGDLVLFLASDKSSYINGASVELTGGFN